MDLINNSMHGSDIQQSGDQHVEPQNPQQSPQNNPGSPDQSRIITRSKSANPTTPSAKPAASHFTPINDPTATPATPASGPEPTVLRRPKSENPFDFWYASVNEWAAAPLKRKRNIHHAGLIMETPEGIVSDPPCYQCKGQRACFIYKDQSKGVRCG